jgi:transcriptional regulator with XRE-family HTH domain
MAISDHVARRVRQERESRGMTRAALAARCTALGWPCSWPCTKTIITNLELGMSNGRKCGRPVRVDELVVIAAALDVPVLDFLAGARLPPGAHLTDPPRTVTIRLPAGARITIDE